ncbi:hypothetical protein OpiT1DRAFT_03461 [Opitutaceae bacterium TAV1]|nr:hypothetical protein OpiT1DRAFT_03461 [Opitutaceae bacterium TAV1]
MTAPDHNRDGNDDPLDEKEPGFFRRYGIVLAVCAVIAGGIAWWLVSTASGPKPSAPKPQEFSMIRVALPPPPPPPPPPQPKPEDTPKPEEQQQMIEQEPVPADEPQEKPAESPEPPGEDATPMGTNIQGDGPADGFGLVGRGGGSVIGGTGTGTGSGGRGSSRWGWYAAQVQTTVAEALRRNERTRVADLRITVRIWPDEGGRIRAARLVGSTGNRDLDAAIEKDVLTGLTLREPPPADMPAPIVLRLTARRP